jgi:excisionase family DNA binding protein
MASGESSPELTTSLLDELITARQIAETLQMRVSTVEAYARRGLLPSVKLGRYRRFIKSEVERAIGLLQSGLPAATDRFGITNRLRQDPNRG